jgi:hypothetical protein
MVMDVAVPFAAGGFIQGAERIVAIRAGRIAITSEEAVAGKAGRISLDLEEEDKVLGREGGHALDRHVNVDRQALQARAARSRNPESIYSSFFSKELAEDASNDVVRMHRNEIRQWLMNANPGATRAWEVTSTKILGEGTSRASGVFTSYSRARVAFKMARQGGRLVYIITAFPVP